MKLFLSRLIAIEKVNIYYQLIIMIMALNEFSSLLFSNACNMTSDSLWSTRTFRRTKVDEKISSLVMYFIRHKYILLKHNFQIHCLPFWAGSVYYFLALWFKHCMHLLSSCLLWFMETWHVISDLPVYGTLTIGWSLPGNVVGGWKWNSTLIILFTKFEHSTSYDCAM